MSSDNADDTCNDSSSTKSSIILYKHSNHMNYTINHVIISWEWCIINYHDNNFFIMIITQPILSFSPNFHNRISHIDTLNMTYELYKKRNACKSSTIYIFESRFAKKVLYTRLLFNFAGTSTHPVVKLEH